VPDAGCTPETDRALCARLAKDCGTLAASDNCGTLRSSISCGACVAPKICGGASTANVCGTYAGTPVGGTPLAIGAATATWYAIEGEQYDVGGEGVAFHDTTPTNTLGAFRIGPGDDVDVEQACGNNCFDVAAIAPGEWTKHTVNVITAGTYMVQVGAASATPKNMHLEVDGVNVSGAIAINTGSATSFRTLSQTFTFSMTAGVHVLTFAYDDGSMALNWIKLQRQ
jgi:hypothetical protein